MQPYRHLFWLAGWILLSCRISTPTNAQIVPDSSLPSPSMVTPEGSTFMITGGTRAGGNLFHSFAEFGVPTGGTAYFNNATQIQNIFSRVTGGNLSEIDGLIHANGTANLFLLNPKGIIFGPQARLNIGGSFFASTADSIQFADRTEFPTTPSETSPLLTVSVPIGLQLGQNPGKIVVNGATLEVPTRQTLSLIGVDIAISGGNLIAPAGKINLFSAIDAQWSAIADNPPLTPDLLRNIQLSNAASVNASGTGGGEIQVRGSRVFLTEQSKIVADTTGSESGKGIYIQAERLELSDRSFISASTLGAGNGGDLNLRVSDSIQLTGTGIYQEILDRLFNQQITSPAEIGTGIFTLSFGMGGAGNLSLETPNLLLENGSFISTATFGNGTGGNLNANASHIELKGSQLFADNFGDGDAGNVSVNAQILRVEEGGAIAASTFGAGQGGTIEVNASESIESIGTTPNYRFNSGIFASAYQNASQPAGNLNIQTGRLIVRDGAKIAASTFSDVSGGTIGAIASEIEVSGTSADGRQLSSIETQSQGAGSAGDLTLDTRSLLVQDGAFISAGTLGTGSGGNLTIRASESVQLIGMGTFDLATEVQAGRFQPSDLRDGLFTSSTGIGNAGNLSIATRRLSARNKANVSSSTLTEGAGGNLTVTASDTVELNNSFLLTGTAGSGHSGDLTIHTGQLILRNQAQVITSTLGTGSGGNLTVNASESLQLDNSATITTTLGRGDAGNLRITTSRLLLQNQSAISTSTFSEGKGGNLEIAATESVELRNQSSLSTDTAAQGNAGDLQIDTRSLTIRDIAGITVSSQGEGEAGNLTINTNTLYLLNGLLFASTASGQGGNINLQVADFMTLRQNSQISAEAGGIGNGGNVTINTEVLGVLENSQIRATAVQGQGGKIQIYTQGLLTAPNSQITASSQAGIDGVVNVNTPDLDPSQGLIPLPADVLNIANLVFQGCGEESGSTLLIAGRGGLPPSPNDPLTAETVLPDLGSIERGNRGALIQNSKFKIQNSNSPSPLIEARGWVRDANGQIVLTREPHNRTPSDLWYPPTICISQK